MTDAPARIDSGSFLTLHYRLSGPDGADIVNTFNDKPATLSLGTQELAPALQQRLLGLSEGESASFELPAGETYGERNADLLRWVSRSLLRKMGDPLESFAVGEVVQFPAPDGQSQMAGIVREVADAQVLFDFNHPLAGQPVRFDVKIIGVL